MVVIVQLFTADDDAPRHDVTARVLGLESAVTPVVADTVDNSRGKKRNPHHLHRPDRDADEAEQREIDNHHACYAGYRMRCVDVALHPIVGSTLAEFLERVRVFRFQLVKVGAFPHYLADAEDLRAVRILRRFTTRVVLAVHRGPFLGLHAGGQPQPEAEEMAYQRMQVERAVRRVPVQIDRDGRNGDVSHCQRGDHVAPPRKIEYA